MKLIMISIQPQHTMNILNLIKKLEIRKTCPREWKDYLSGKTKVKPEPMKCVIYCTQGRDVLSFDIEEQKYALNIKNGFLNGQVVAEFTLNMVEQFTPYYVPYSNKNNLGYEHFIDDGVYKIGEDGIVFERPYRYISTMLKNEDLGKMCLTPSELFNYIGIGKKGYAWHIDDLKIYDTPKELSEFGTVPSSIGDYKCKYKERKMNLFSGYTHDICLKHHCRCFVKISRQNECDEYERVFESKKLTRPPQSWCYVEKLEDIQAELQGEGK